MSRYKGLFVAASLLFSTTVFPEASDKSSLWLQRMNDALYNLDYEGHFVYLHNNSLEGMRISHRFEDGILKAQLISLNGAQREVIREDKKISIIRHHAGKLKISQRPISSNLSPLMQIDTEQLQDFYQFKTNGRARVAGRMGRVITIEPKDNLRYGYRIVLDKSSGLPLDVTILNESNELVSQMMFTDLTINDSQSHHKKDQGMSALGQKVASGIGAAGTSKRWYFENLPPGYVQSTHRYKSRKGAQKEVEHFMFSDGLATISVYTELRGKPKAKDSGFSGPTSLGSVNAYARSFDTHKVTAVGEVPMLALQQIVEGIRQKDD